MRLFQKHVVHTKFDIYVFIKMAIMSDEQKMDATHQMTKDAK